MEPPRRAPTRHVRAVRLRLAVALAVVTPLGFASKAYGGAGAGWVGPYGGGVLYVVFWIALALLARPRWRPAPVAAAVLAVTCALEALQLWHPPFLEAVRGTYLGHAVIGSSFAWLDFPHYALGALAGGLLGRAAGCPARPSPSRPAP